MDIEVDRGDLSRVRVVEGERPALTDGESRLRIDRFGFSSNNITYAVVGEMLRYWDFFPAAPSEPSAEVAWGRIPMWGFAEVVESAAPALSVGERLFGYLPMSRELVIRPGALARDTVRDLSPHRAALPSAYNDYRRCAEDPSYRPEREDAQMLMYPLFFTSFLIDDFLADQDDYDAAQMIISSASSKTAIGAARLLHDRGCRVVGLTSAGNAEFTRSLGVYEQVLDYGAVADLARVASVYIDIAGNGDVLAGVHRHLEDFLAHSMTVGDTHHDHQSAPSEDPLPGPSPSFFFAPSQLSKRAQEWGSDELTARMSTAWDSFVEWLPSWLEIRQLAGADAVLEIYRAFLSGRVDPRLGYACTLDAGEREA